jgi:thiamine-phosphate pyrophosphorylase
LAGADFVLVGDLVWADPRGAAAALADIGQTVRQAYAETRAASKAAQGSSGI